MVNEYKVKDFEIAVDDTGSLVGSSKDGFVTKLIKLFEEDYDDTDYYLYDREHNQFVRFYKDGFIKVDIFEDNEENEKALSILRCTHYDLMDTGILK